MKFYTLKEVCEATCLLRDAVGYFKLHDAVEDFLEGIQKDSSGNKWLKNTSQTTTVPEDIIISAANKHFIRRHSEALLKYLGIDYECPENVYDAIKNMGREELSHFLNKVYKQGRLDKATEFEDRLFENGKVLDLPKTTKIMIDGKALYVHRANFQVIDTGLLQ